MLNKETALQLVQELKKLKSNYEIDPSVSNKNLFKRHENLCMLKFDYIVKMDARRYKNYDNYQDLLQEGFIALSRALETYEESKGDIFWWIHKYTVTKIARKSNKYFVVDFPLAKAKKLAVNVRKIQVQHLYSPTLSRSHIDNTYMNLPADTDYLYESKERTIAMNKAISLLPEIQKGVIKTFLDQDRVNIMELSKINNMSKDEYKKQYRNSINSLKKTLSK